MKTNEPNSYGSLISAALDPNSPAHDRVAAFVDSERRLARMLLDGREPAQRHLWARLVALHNISRAVAVADAYDRGELTHTEEQP